MITRVWHGTTRRDDATAYREYVVRTGVADYRKTRGNLGVRIWQKHDGEVTHIWTITEWDGWESIRAFAGNEVEKARYYPEDHRYLLELEPTVQHYETMTPPSVHPWRITM